MTRIREEEDWHHNTFCRLSVTLVQPTQSVEFYHNIFVLCRSLVIRLSSEGNSAKYSQLFFPRSCCVQGV